MNHLPYRARAKRLIALGVCFVAIALGHSVGGVATAQSAPAAPASAAPAGR